MGKRPTAWRTGARWGAAIQTCLIIQRALTAGITSGHISSSLCKLQLSTHLSSSRNTNGHHTEIFLCWAASSLEGSLGAGKSCYPKSPGKNPSPCPTLADTQTASFQTAAGTTKLCAHCTKQTYRIENWRQRLCAENTGTSHLSCWNR